MSGIQATFFRTMAATMHNICVWHPWFAILSLASLIHNIHYWYPWYTIFIPVLHLSYYYFMVDSIPSNLSPSNCQQYWLKSRPKICGRNPPMSYPVTKPNYLLNFITIGQLNAVTPMWLQTHRHTYTRTKLCTETCSVIIVILFIYFYHTIFKL